MTTFLSYLVILSPLTFFVGFWLGKRYGWEKRDLVEHIKDLKNEKFKVEEMKSTLYNVIPETIKQMQFNIIEIPATTEKNIKKLEEELKQAIEEENYEKAAQIKKIMENRDNKNE
jgi:excinuclease UvrABC helicase subunit UvrB